LTFWSGRTYDPRRCQTTATAAANVPADPAGHPARASDRRSRRGASRWRRLIGRHSMKCVVPRVADAIFRQFCIGNGMPNETTVAVRRRETYCADVPPLGIGIGRVGGLKCHFPRRDECLPVHLSCNITRARKFNSRRCRVCRFAMRQLGESAET
jgi:hypothetical protein